MTAPKTPGLRHCVQCKEAKPTHAFQGFSLTCKACANTNDDLRLAVNNRKGEIGALKQAAAQINREAKASKLSIPAISEVVDGMFKEFGGVAEICRVARELYSPVACETCGQGHPKYMPGAKVRLEILKFITNLLVMAHQQEGQINELDEIPDDDLDDTIIQLAEMRGWKVVRPDEKAA